MAGGISDKMVVNECIHILDQVSSHPVYIKYQQLAHYCMYGSYSYCVGIPSLLMHLSSRELVM